MKGYTLHHAAEAEVQEALAFYHAQSARLARDLRNEIKAALNRVRQNPQLYAVDDDAGARFCPLHRFPYTLVYLVLDDAVWIAALAHQHRRPGYWSRRRPDE